MGAFLRELLESLALVVILGLLPVGAHWLFSLEKAGDTRDWVAPELYLFVMVASGHAAAEAFRDTEHLIRSVVFIGSALGVLISAAAYGLLYVHPMSRDARPAEVWLQANVTRAMLGAALGYTVYRGFTIFRELQTNLTNHVANRDGA
jgi:hypothetical protein